MLNVPDEIKELLHRDSCKKNIRICFPNGERTDICNDLIVKDSVSFKESLCSQDTLKFGLCESSVFECETVGVGNIKGATIRVFCEIFCQPSVQDALWQTDLQAWVYQIPYGTFIVQSCDRQADLLHRKIVAYTSTSETFFVDTEEEYAKSRVRFSSNVAYTPNLIYFSYINGFRYSDELFNVSVVTPITLTNITKTALYKGYTFGAIIESEKRWYMGRHNNIDREDPNCLYTLTGDDSKLRKFINDFSVTAAKQFNEDVGFFQDFFWNFVGSSAEWNDDALNNFACPSKYMPVTFFPYITGYFSSSENKHFRISAYGNNIRLSVSKNGTSVTELQNVGFDCTLEKRELLSAYQYLTLNFTRTYKSNSVSPGGAWYINFNPDSEQAKTYDSLSAAMLFDLNNSFLEINGFFGKISRYDSIKVIDIKEQFDLLPSTTLYPGSAVYPEGVTGGKLLPEDYQSCWYNDEYMIPFGAVECTYVNTNNENCSYFLYLSGFDDNSDINNYRIYRVNENNSIIARERWTQEQIEAICNIIAANIEGVTYMPVEFIGRGLPYVEAGDTFEILTKSNDSITTIVLNRTISGEITLTDTYKSV